MLNDILSPARRKAIHDLMPHLVILAVATGHLTEIRAIGVAGVLLAVLDCLVAAAVTRSGVRRAVYSLAAAVATALIGWGAISGQLAEQLLGAFSAVLGVILAGSNTDPSTPDGAPTYESRAVLH